MAQVSHVKWQENKPAYLGLVCQIIDRDTLNDTILWWIVSGGSMSPYDPPLHLYYSQLVILITHHVTSRVTKLWYKIVSFYVSLTLL